MLCSKLLPTTHSQANEARRSIHDIEKRLRDVDDRLWDVEEHLMGERLEDGKVYVKRRYHDP